MDPFIRFDSMRPFDCFALLEIGFTAFQSHRVYAVKERKSAGLARMNDAQLVVDDIFARVEGLSLVDRCEVLAGPEMNSATAALSAAVQAFAAPPRVRPVVVSIPHVRRRTHSTAGSELAYRALTLCVFPLHRGHLESYKMDRGVRLAKAFLIVDEHDMFASRIALWHGRGDVVFAHMTSLLRNVQVSILMRLRRLSLDFVPLGVLGDCASVPSILSGLTQRCMIDAYYRAALVDPKGPTRVVLHF
jgi:hypothetical protein